MKKNSRLLTLKLVVMAILLSLLLASGCGDPNREDCKKACVKLMECDQPENGGDGVLDLQWSENCKTSCDEADEINQDMSQCIVEKDCAELKSVCGSPSGE